MSSSLFKCVCLSRSCSVEDGTERQILRCFYSKERSLLTPNYFCCISQSAHLSSPHYSVGDIFFKSASAGCFWGVLIVLVGDVWKAIFRPSERVLLWMRALTGLEERASYVHFWLELLLRGWWSRGQRLHWAGNHYTKPSVLTGAPQQPGRQRLATSTTSCPLVLGRGRSQADEHSGLWSEIMFVFLLLFFSGRYSWSTFNQKINIAQQLHYGEFIQCYLEIVREQYTYAPKINQYVTVECKLQFMCLMCIKFNMTIELDF